MNVAQLCPDDLLASARRGALSAQEQARLEFHLARCTRCQATLDVGKAFDAALGARSGDDAIAMRIAAEVTRPAARHWFAAGRVRGRARVRGVTLAAGLLLLGSVTVAAASSRIWLRYFPNLQLSWAEPAQEQASTQTQSGPSRGKAAVEAVPTLNAAGSGQPAPDVVPSAALEVAKAPDSIAVRGPQPSAPSTESAASLFADANAQRSKGEGELARKRYLELQARFSGSTEARVSLVSLGRIELARSPAQALRHFDQYLGQGQHTTLTEEALFGRASALQRLGRVQAERKTWQQLIERYPSSVYAERARARLATTP
jgi:hypothetical protein